MYTEQKGSRQSRRRHTGSRDAVPTGSGFRQVVRRAGGDQPGARGAPVSVEGPTVLGVHRGRAGPASGVVDVLQSAGHRRGRVEDGARSEPVDDHRADGLVRRICRQTGDVRRHELRHRRTVSGNLHIVHAIYTRLYRLLLLHGALLCR